MLEVYWDPSKGWSKPKIRPFHMLELHPFNATLHYASTGFEGMKAFRDPNGGIRIFRPDAHARRFLKTCEYLSFPQFDPEEFVKCLSEFIKLEARWVPEFPSSLYIRPTMISVDANLGLTCPEKAMFFIVASPAKPLFNPENPPIKMLIETRAVRAWPGGTGNVKIGANYAIASKYDIEAIHNGYDEVLWLNSDKITEASGCTFLLIMKNEKNEPELIAPELDGTILPGITRDSILQIAKNDLKMSVFERAVTIPEILKANSEKRILEMFVCGTAVSLMPVGSITYKDTKIEALKPKGETSLEIRKRLLEIQYGKVEHNFSHIVLKNST